MSALGTHRNPSAVRATPSDAAGWRDRGRYLRRSTFCIRAEEIHCLDIRVSLEYLGQLALSTFTPEIL